MRELDYTKMHYLQLNPHELVKIRALCDEVMNSLCQAKALLQAVDEESFFQRLDDEVLRHYFYALDTVINSALLSKDQISRVIDDWGRPANSRED